MSNYGRTIGKHVRRDLANAIRTFNAGDPRAVPPHRLDPAVDLPERDVVALHERLRDENQRAADAVAHELLRREAHGETGDPTDREASAGRSRIEDLEKLSLSST